MAAAAGGDEQGQACTKLCTGPGMSAQSQPRVEQPLHGHLPLQWPVTICWTTATANTEDCCSSYIKPFLSAQNAVEGLDLNSGGGRRQ